MGIADWDITLPKSSRSLVEYDDYLREVKEDWTAWYAAEHKDTGAHTLSYLTRTARLALTPLSGNIVRDSTDGYAYRSDGTTWTRLGRKGRILEAGGNVTPTVTDFDRVVLSDKGQRVRDFTGSTGQRITVLARATVVVEDGTYIKLHGSVNFNMHPGFVLRLELFADGIWYELGRHDDDVGASNPAPNLDFSVPFNNQYLLVI